MRWSKSVVVGVVAAFACLAFAVNADYGQLCADVVVALSDDSILLSDSFVNRMRTVSCQTNVEDAALAEMVLAMAASTAFEQEVDGRQLELCATCCTNILSNHGLPTRSWQKSAASVLYAVCLGFMGQHEESYSVCTNALTLHLASPTTDVERAVWSAMVCHEVVPDISVTNALDFCAALSLLIQGNQMAVVYTNGLPSQAIQRFLKATE